MKICLFSDIHGNGPAFEAAYPQLLNEQADLNIFLGDLCGYYFDEIEIYHKLICLPNLIALRGNHDNMYIAAVDGDEDMKNRYLMKYGSSMKIFLRKDFSSMMKWLKIRPETYTCEDLDLACYHGSPKNQLEGYVYPDTDLKEVSDERQSNIFLGHTHYPMHRFVGNTMIVNPGSLGQPRQNGWPTYAVVTFPERRVEFKEVSYDAIALVNRIEQEGEKKSYLKDVLLRCYA